MSDPYRPGQPQWHAGGPQRPDRPPPIQLHHEQPSPPGGGGGLRWTLRVAGLVAVAVISGLVWYYITKDDASGGAATDVGSQDQVDGVYSFSPHPDMAKPNSVTDCAAHSYGATKTWFKSNPCEHLSRQLFVTRSKDGRTVYVSVSVVTMSESAKAGDLQGITDTDGKGNVADVVKDGLVRIDGLGQLTGGGGYASKWQDREVTIVEADFAPTSKPADEKKDDDSLDEICNDALRLGKQLGVGSGG
ncbi:hypothetical protein [Actinophytocola sp.]|uniref:hypothetical protein n=1 Tax=Actinophytocola sp. TaxID=1872138 RepID=UPI00389A5B16